MKKIYTVTNPDQPFSSRFVMRAPLHILRIMFKLHPDAEKRLVHETAAGDVCELHFNGRNEHFIRVWVSLGSERECEEKVERFAQAAFNKVCDSFFEFRRAARRKA